MSFCTTLLEVMPTYALLTVQCIPCGMVQINHNCIATLANSLFAVCLIAPMYTPDCGATATKVMFLKSQKIKKHDVPSGLYTIVIGEAAINFDESEESFRDILWFFNPICSKYTYPCYMCSTLLNIMNILLLSLLGLKGDQMVIMKRNKNLTQTDKSNAVECKK